MSTTTKVFTTGKRRYDLAELPKVGDAIKKCPAYPLMHDTYGNDDFIVVHSVHVDDGILQVIGDCDNGWYEWVWFVTPTSYFESSVKTGDIRHTRSGWGMASRCLQDGLNFAFKSQVGYGEPNTHELA